MLTAMDATYAGIQRPERHHWTNTFVGLLDMAFVLSDTEQIHAARIVDDLLAFLRIPERGVPSALPVHVSLEVTSGFFARHLHEPRLAGTPRTPPADGSTTEAHTLEAWRQHLMSLVLTAYPDLEPIEMLGLAQVANELLAGLGIPDRAPVQITDAVVRAASHP